LVALANLHDQSNFSTFDPLTNSEELPEGFPDIVLHLIRGFTSDCQDTQRSAIQSFEYFSFFHKAELFKSLIYLCYSPIEDLIESQLLIAFNLLAILLAPNSHPQFLLLQEVWSNLEDNEKESILNLLPRSLDLANFTIKSLAISTFVNIMNLDISNTLSTFL
jgi:hypothetical protein